jgi:BirA family biotin operon repressor/biotin-[acetyl-CoA-carboxylase] ligase
MGINVNFEPEEGSIPDSATTLQKELGSAVSREELAVALFNSLDLWYRCLTRDAETVYAAWSSRLAMMGSPLLVVDHTGSWQGVATGVRRDGGLLVRDRSGVIRTVYAADVSIRKPDSSAQEALQVRKGIVK